MHLVTMVSIAPLCDDNDLKIKVAQNTCFIIFFTPAHSGYWELKLAACAPSDHGDNVTSMFNDIEK